MDETDFWLLIDETREAADGDSIEHADLLVERLSRRAPDDALDFARLFEARFRRAFRWDLWGAAHLLLHGADDEAFDYFRCWLVGQGREVFEGALDEPDDLADLVPDFDEEQDGDAEELGYAGEEAYERLTGSALPDLGLPPEPTEPAGPYLDFGDADQMAERFPQLWERHAS